MGADNFTKSVQTLANNLKSQSIIFSNIKFYSIFVNYIKHTNFSEIPPTSHSFFELNFIIDGEILTTINGKTIHVSAGDAFLIPPGCVHSHQSINNKDYSDICIQFKLKKVCDTHDFDDFSQTLLSPVSKAFKFDIKKLITDNSNFISSQLVFLQILSNLSILFKTLKPSKNISSNNICTEAREYLANNYMKHIDMNKLASSLGVTYRHLSRIYKQETGLTITKDLNGIRIDHAKTMLENSDLSVNEIASNVGFSSASYFCKVFYEHVFLSPTQYKNFKNIKGQTISNNIIL